MYRVMKTLAVVLILAMLAAACSTDGPQDAVTTTTLGPSPLSTVADEPVPTIAASTSTSVPPPEISLIQPQLGGVLLIADSDFSSSEGDVFLEGDADYGIAAAFDDLAGGLVYQYSTTPEPYPESSILHLAAGRTIPEVALFAEPGRRIRLLDVESIDGRTNVLYLDGPVDSEFDSIRLADLAGGAPLLIALADAAAEPGSVGVAPSGIINGSLAADGVAIVWTYSDPETTCSYVEVREPVDEGATTFGPMPEFCGERDFTHAALSPDGGRLALAGDALISVVDTGSGGLLAEWPAADVVGLDFDGSTVVVTRVGGIELLPLAGQSSFHTQSDPFTSQLVVSARGPVELDTGVFLGGIRELSPSCSAAGMGSTIEPQGGLPEPVAATRQAIVSAATACDADALERVSDDRVASNFGGWPDSVRFWRWREQDGYGVLARMVDVLALPFVIDDTPAGRIYTWPSAFQEQPSDADWDALASVFNEEDIDLFKEFGAYIGMRVGIAEDGTWLFALEGD